MTNFWKSIPHDLFDFQQFYNDVAAAMPNNCRCVEIGVADGASSIFLAERLAGLNKQFTLRMVDNLDYGRLDQLSDLYKRVYVSGQYENIEIVPLDSLNASLKYPDGYFDFVFIDSGHTYELTKAEVRLWWRKLKDGGILAGHDSHLDDVKKAVTELCDEVEFYETTKQWGVWKINKSHLTVIR
jgi:predicted O-methyltransferase YrrM